MTLHKALANVPHARGENPPISERGPHGYPLLDVIVPCGRRVAVTLTTRTDDRVRCLDCLAALAFGQEAVSDSTGSGGTTAVQHGRVGADSDDQLGE